LRVCQCFSTERRDSASILRPILIDDGLKPPPGILKMKEYGGMSAEEIYPYRGGRGYN